ncbi:MULTISPECIES: histidine triad nucleotide-binding protein [Thioalkalivibrio]|uniref:Histidine triad nucleotide-binding protein n=1 Tax=Thioalkalivibrio halophilus TaxID=252474 RepID=A0A1V3A0A4_9GAMM|nr:MULTISPECIES: histidine triad nucleotide-binding protein [Thioalkalivibrio]OOC10761.1 histidine triad nucleotide-binding protein [Thioalkalivibrio halophilus]PYG04489.1 histidine triad (HIT) family protein [Thioalkalivibrio sp. ALE21]
MEDCIFCKIVAGEIPATIVRETDDVIAFEDLHPQAPHHVLVIPRRHIATLNDLTAEDAVTVGNMARVAAEVAAERGFAEAGYRTVMNCNQQGGQTVYHIHMHLLGGRPLGWPPG